MRKIAMLNLLLLFSALSMGQQENPEKDVKVGLVLSGGGAKGLAHIGALKVIEEAGVKIDFVGGTSMGAIVGGLYAAGYSAVELDSIFRTTNLATLIQDNLPRGAKSFYEKEASEKYALTLPFSKFKISFPSAYSGGQNIYNELVRILYHVRGIDDFDKLPIPFLCIATDVETGDEVLLDQGYLPEAIMASATLPSLFEPAIMGDKVLIDGGIVNNYPIQEVKNMGADVVIGVDVQKGLRGREDLMSATEILLQINNYKAALNMEKKSKLTDIYIKPDIEDYSVVDFNSGSKIIESGETSAKQNYTALQEISKQQAQNGTDYEYADIKDSINIKQLIIGGNEGHSRGYVKGKLRFELDEKTTFEKLQQGISNLSATGNFKTIRYELMPNGNGDNLLLNLNENPIKTHIRLGAHYDDLYKTAAIVNLTHKKLLLKDDVTSLDFVFGDNLRYNFHYFVDKGTYWSFGVNSRYSDFKHDVPVGLVESNFDLGGGVNLNTIRFEVRDVTNQAYMQTVLREEFAFSLGAEHKFLRYSTNTLVNGNDGDAFVSASSSADKRIFDKSHYYSAFGKLVLDTYDDKYFPSKGLYFNGDFHFYGLSSDFNDNFKEFSIAKIRTGGAFPILDNLSVNIETEGGFKLGTSSVSSFDFVLGGYGAKMINNFVPFYGYDFLSLVGNSYVKAYGRLDYEFAQKHHLTFAANFANLDDDLFRTGEWFTEPDYSGYGLGYGWESFLGPVQLIYSWSREIKQNNFFFSVGYWF